ncbi:MAG: hypothetical protein ABL967_08860 [Bryobacteraceae bacterium]
MFSKISIWVAAVAMGASCAGAATLGTVVPIHGSVSDIAVDDSRGRLYAANFSGYRIEVVDRNSRKLLSPISVSAPPSAVALSPDSRYLVIGEYQRPIGDQDQGFQTESGGLTIVDLTNGGLRHIDLATPVLTVSFGVDGRALIVTRLGVADDTGNLAPNILTLEPVTGIVGGLATITFRSRNLPTGTPLLQLNTFPGEIIQTSAGVSGDLKKIIVLGAVEEDSGAASTKSILMSYDVPTHTLSPIGFETTPPQGPRVVSVNQIGDYAIAGWGLNHYINGDSILWAQFPDVRGKFHIGSHIIDRGRNLVYANMPSTDEEKVLHVMDTDNLTVRERIQIPERLAGKSLMTSDGEVMYSASISGVTVFPIGQLPQTARIGTTQEDVLFRTADFCNATLLGQTLDVISLGSTPTDFKLTLPDGVRGVTLSATGGTTPAQIRITVDPAYFQLAKGTTVIPLAITSTTGVNLAPDVRLLINAGDSAATGRIVNVPGRLVDVLSDAGRNRLYILRQDKNAVLVYDSKTLAQIGTLRTGNTPVHMAFSIDQKYLLVGNDNSQIASVFDLATLQPSEPIIFPPGHYPRAIGVANGAIFAISRNAGRKSECADQTPTAALDTVFLDSRVAVAACTLDGPTNPSIFYNNLPTPDGILTASPDNNYLLLVLSDGNVAQYDASVHAWVASRKDLTSADGAYAAVDGGTYLVGASVLNAALVPSFTFADVEGTVTSGETMSGGWGIRTAATAANAPGLIQRWNTQDFSIAASAAIPEAPVTVSTLRGPAIGQIGQTILSFTRSAAASQDQLTLYALTISGITVVDGTFGNSQPSRPTITSIVSAADNRSLPAPGGLVAISGNGLSKTSAAFSGYPLSTLLGQTCVTANNTLVPLFFVSGNQINAQIPYEVSGATSVVVHTSDGDSAAFTVTVPEASPAVWLNGSAGPLTGLPLVYRQANGQLATGSNPVHRNSNDTLLVYLTGMGRVSPAVPSGAAAPSSPTSSVITTATATFGGVTAAVNDAVLTPGQAGVNQLTISVPRNTPTGLTVPLTITQGGQSQTVNLRVVD